MAVANLFLGLVGQRPVQDLQQRVVLPQAEAERERDGDQRDDDAGAQLLKVIDVPPVTPPPATAQRAVPTWEPW